MDKGFQKPQLDQFLEFCRKKAAEARDAKPAAPEHPSCEICDGHGWTKDIKDGYEVVHKCVCRRENEFRQHLRDAGIPEKYWPTTLHDKPQGDRQPFKPWGGKSRDIIALESQKRALQSCRQVRDLYIDHFIKGRHQDDLYGLMLFGDPGRGKTRLLCSLLVDLIHAGMTKIHYVEYNQLFKEIRFSFRSNRNTYERIFQRMLSPDILVIDDLGTDISGDLYWVLDNIGYIINERYGSNLPTLFASNHWRSLEDESSSGGDTDGNIYANSASWEVAQKLKEEKKMAEHQKGYEDLQKRVSYRLRSRIREMCLEVKLEGFDYRNKLARNREMLLARQAQLRERGKK